MKKQLTFILNRIDKHLNDKFRIKNIFLNKKTARARAKVLLKNSNGNQYILEIARNNIEEFYLTRTVEIPSKIAGPNLINAVFFGQHESSKYALFPVIQNAQHFNHNLPTTILKQIEGEKKSVQLDEKQKSLVLSGFLSAWPIEIHSHICKMSLFKEFVDQLQTTRETMICNEHGDLSPNNVLYNEVLTVIDFEFFKPYQIAGFDTFYNKKIRGLSFENQNSPINMFHELKLNLINAINKDFDFGLTNIIFHINKNINTVFINGENLGEREVFLEIPRSEEQIQLFFERLIKYNIKIDDVAVCSENIALVKKYANFKNVLNQKVAMYGYVKTLE